MTVNTIGSIAEFDTNGVTTNYPFYFKFLANEDLVVTYVDPLGVSSTLTLGTHYTANGAGSDQGGSIVTTNALAGPGQLIVSREMEAFQQTSLRNQGKFLAETHEDVFDKLTMLIQQGFAIFGRALKRPFGRDYFFAENRQIKSVKDPTDQQDAATLGWTDRYVAGVIGAITGPINNALNVFYRAPDGTAHVVQNLAEDSLGLRGIAYRGRDAWVAMNWLGVSPMDFGAPGFGTTDTIDALELAAAEMKRLRIPLNIDAFFMASRTLVIEDVNGGVIRGTGAIRTSSDTAKYVLDIKNCTGITTEGNISIDGNSKTNIIAAIRVAAIGTAAGVMRTCSLHHLKLDALNSGSAWQIGDFSAPDNLISEIKLSGTTYNTPVGMTAIGSQCVVNLTGMDLVAAGQGVFASYAHGLVISHGAMVILTGSEAQMPGVSNGFGFTSSPIDSPAFDNIYGSFVLQSCPVETPSLLFIAYNSRSVPSPQPDTGGIIINGCRGYHNCDVGSFQGAADFSGSVLVGDNGFFRTTPKSSVNAGFFGAAKVRISDTAFDDHFVKGLAGISGGIALFDYQNIFEANNLSGVSMASGTSVLGFASVPAAPENSHFYGDYNPSTGVFTVPLGGLKNVRVQVNFQNAQPNTGSALQVRVNGSIRASSAANSTYCSGSFELGNLVAGDLVVAQFLNAGASFSAVGGAQDRIVISARR